MALDRNWGGEPGHRPRASKDFESKSRESLESYQRGFRFPQTLCEMDTPRIQDYDGCLRYDLHGTPTFDLNLRLAER